MNVEYKQPFVYWHDLYASGDENYHQEACASLYAACQRALAIKTWKTKILAIGDGNGASLRFEEAQAYIERCDLATQVESALQSSDLAVKDAAIRALAKALNIAGDTQR